MVVCCMICVTNYECVMKRCACIFLCIRLGLFVVCVWYNVVLFVLIVDGKVTVNVDM